MSKDLFSSRMMQDKKRVIGEISVPAAQEWLDECHFKYETGW